MELPHSTDAERALLGIILNHNEIFWEVEPIVSQADFYEPWHGEQWILIADLISANKQATAMILMHSAQDADIGGIKASENLRKIESEAGRLPTALARGFAHAIQQTALRRRLADFGAEVSRMALAAPVSTTSEELRLRAEETMSGLFRSVSDTGLRHIGDVGDDILKVLKVKDRASAGLELKMIAVEQLFGRLLPGRLYVLAGSPGSGKTGLVQQIAENVGSNGFTSAIFSAEMSAVELACRAMVAETGIPMDDIERQKIDRDEDFERLWTSNERLRKLPIFIDAAARPTVAMIRSRAARKKKMGGLHLIVIDHLHYLRAPQPKMSAYEAHDDNLMELKAMAKELEVPVLVISQLGSEGLRELAKWPHRRPESRDLLFQAAIDRSADAVGILYREEHFLKRSPPPLGAHYQTDYDVRLKNAENVAHFILTKRKGGIESGVREMYFDGPRVRFSDDIRRKMFKPGELPLDMIA